MVICARRLMRFVVYDCYELEVRTSYLLVVSDRPDID